MDGIPFWRIRFRIVLVEATTLNTVTVMSLVFGVKLTLLIAVRPASLFDHNHPLVCESIDGFSSVRYGETNGENYCDNGIHVTRKCLSTGRWGVIEYYGNCSRFSIPILFLFVCTSSLLVCTTASGLMDGLVGMLDEKVCSFGAVVRVCNEIGHWELTQDDCACAAEGLWEQTELGETRQLQCGNGGLLRRTCMNTGYWAEQQDFNCSK